jgi:hypothetical protein
MLCRRSLAGPATAKANLGRRGPHPGALLHSELASGQRRLKQGAQAFIY